jgi:hypothetical protein
MSPLLLVTALLATSPSQTGGAETVVSLKVRPFAAPSPALKYQLLPEVRELNPGNAVQWYVRCFMEQRIFFFSKEANAERARYLTMPLGELPAKQLRTYGGSALRQADWGARLDTVDWQVSQRVKDDGMDLLLPEVGPLQVLGTALRVRFRGQVAGRHFDDAVATTKTMFALARHLGEHPTQAANLAGLSVAGMAVVPLEEMVQQPGCPNLYWALTDLPSPLVDLRKGAQGNRTLVATDLGHIKDSAPMTEAELDTVVRRLSEAVSFAREQAGLTPRSLRGRLASRAADAQRVQAARHRLVEGGCAKDMVERFGAVQVILLDEKHDYEVRRDEAMKLLGLASWEIDALTGGHEPAQNGDCLFADVLPEVVKVRRAQARLEQRLALLRHVEALRLFAANHDGKLPEKLANIGLPLPPDPFTGKAFPYHAEGATARLHGSPPPGEETNPAFNVCYEVTMTR